jgi:hypothetical protein
LDRTGGPQNRYKRCAAEKNLLPLLGIEQRVIRTPRSRALLEKAQLLIKFPAFYEAQHFIFVLTRARDCPHHQPGEFSPYIHNILLSEIINIIPPLMHRSSK